MVGAIASMVKTPVDSIISHGLEYRSSTVLQTKDLFRKVLVFILETFTKEIENISIVGMDKALALEDLKLVDKSLDRLDDLFALLNEVDHELKADFKDFYEALDNLSCSLSCYVDEETMEVLAKMEKGDYSDFEVYKPSSYE